LSGSVLAERRVDGLVVCPTDDGDHAHLEAVISSGVPVVLLERRVSGLHADTVGIDNRKAARDALLAVGVSPRPEYLSANGFHREDADLSATTYGQNAAATGRPRKSRSRDVSRRGLGAAGRLGSS